MSNDNLKVIRSWDTVAKKYSDWLDGGVDQKGKAFTKIVTDNVLDLLGDLSGKKVLDLGCGEGYLSRELALRGATVQGIDGSCQMAQLATLKNSGGEFNIEYKVGDITKTLPYAEGEFHLVVCNMVLMDVFDVGSVVEETRRVLSENGKFLFSIVHPCFYDALGKWIEIGRDAAFMPQKRYLDEVIYMKHLVGLSSDVQLTHYNRPVQYYVNKLLNANMVITDFRETSFSEGYLRSINLYDELKKYNLTANNLIIGAIKTGT